MNYVIQCFPRHAKTWSYESLFNTFTVILWQFSVLSEAWTLLQNNTFCVLQKKRQMLGTTWINNARLFIFEVNYTFIIWISLHMLPKIIITTEDPHPFPMKYISNMLSISWETKHQYYLISIKKINQWLVQVLIWYQRSREGGLRRSHTNPGLESQQQILFYLWTYMHSRWNCLSEDV